MLFYEKFGLETIVTFLPLYLRDATRFAYHTGWRKSEIFTLEWRDIQGDIIHLRPEIAKNKDGRVIILVGEIANIITRRQAERIERIVSHYRAWRTARKKARLPNKILHDARRTAARNMDRAGVSRQTAKQIIGHKMDAMYNLRQKTNTEENIKI